MSHDEAKAIILEGRGTQFDEDVITAFLNVEDRFLAIKEQFKDIEDVPHEK
jgi:putative two-component system response regulator